MSVQSPFTLPLRGLGQGIYTYQLRVDDAFLASFPDAPIHRADINLTMTVDRRMREMVIGFDFAGTVATTCDRCTADIDLPVSGEEHLIVKLVAETDGLEDEANLIYLQQDTGIFNLAPYAYEFVLLAVPMIRTYDCRAGEPPYPCDEDMLDRIDGSVDHSEQPTETPKDQAGPWDVLKNLS